MVHVLPRHCRGPPLKGKYPQRVVVSSRNSPSFSCHRSGRKSSASSPYKSVRRCNEYTLYATAQPFGTRTGADWSFPPPVGRKVVRMAVRELTGTGGKSRRATHVQSAQN